MVGRMKAGTRESWMQEFCLLMTTTDTQTWEGDLVQLASDRYEASPLTSPADAVQRILIERELERRRSLRRLKG